MQWKRIILLIASASEEHGERHRRMARISSSMLFVLFHFGHVAFVLLHFSHVALGNNV